MATTLQVCVFLFLPSFAACLRALQNTAPFLFPFTWILIALGFAFFVKHQMEKTGESRAIVLLLVFSNQVIYLECAGNGKFSERPSKT